MRKRHLLFLLAVVLGFSGYRFGSGYQESPVPAAEVSVNADNFTGNLSTLDDTVQKALDTLDDMTAGSASGDVTAASAFGTDNRVIRSDGTGKGVQASGVTIDDSANVTGVAGLTASANIELSNTTTSTTGVITKGGTPFIHNFQHPTGNTAIPAGYNTFVGIEAGNLTMGSAAMVTTHASYNVAAGYQALTANILGYSNTAVGAKALKSNTSGFRNTAIGERAMELGTSVEENVAIGYVTMNSLTTGKKNTALGVAALFTNKTGLQNTAIGHDAGRYISSGGQTNYAQTTSVFVGANTRPLANDGANEIVIGTAAIGIGSNSVTLGADTITKTALKGNIGIGTTAPSAKLHTIATTEQARFGYDNSNYYTTTVGSTGGVTFDAVGSGSAFTFSDNVSVPDEAYNVNWDGSLQAPTKNAVYDKIQTLGGGGSVTAVGNCASGDCFTGSSGTTLTFKGATSGTTTLAPTAAAGTTAITLPAETGTVCTTGSVCAGYQASLGYTPVSSADWTTNNSYPAACSAGQFVTTLGDTNTCAQPGNVTGNAATATALAADPANCSAGSVAGGITAAGVAEACLDPIVSTEIDTYSELNTIVADVTLTHNGLIDTSAELAGILTDETGSGALVFAVSPALTSDPTAPTAAANDNDTSIATTAFVQTEINGAGGRSLTCSGGSCDADAELYTDTHCYRLSYPLASDDDKSIWFSKQAVTVTSLWCESDQTVNAMLQIDDGTPADIDSVDLVCDATPAEDTSLNGDVTMAAGERLDLDVASVSGTPTWFTICWTVTKDD